MTYQPKSKPRRHSQCITEPLEQRRLLSAGLVVTYSSNASDVSGLSTLSYNNTTLIDDSIQNEQFQVPRYYTLSNGVYTAVGSGPSSHSWNVASDTLTYTYSWGTLTAQYSVPAGSSRLNIAFTVNNTSASTTLGGVVIYPAYIHFPGTITPTDQQQIVGATNPATPLYAPEVAYGIDGPAVLPADYSSASTGPGVMVLANDGPATRQMYTALWSTNYNNAGQGVARPGQDYFIYAGTAPKDTMLSDQAADPTTYTPPITYTNTGPGQSDSFEISLRFGAAGTVPTSLATDIENNYAAAYPQQMYWPDTRPIASLHIASYTSTPSATNPENWSLGGYTVGGSIDTTTTAGLNNFSASMLNYAAGSMSEMTTDHSQGMIVWDLEGEKYAQPNPSYIGDPSLATTLAPEWSYNYQGNGPLIDQFFAAYKAAGFRVGMTLRPTSIQYVNGIPQQTPNDGVGSVPISDEITNLEAKIAYAYSRWGATLFYVDSTTGFDSAALRVVQQAYPNVLLIPEHQTISTFGTAVAYGELTNDFVGTPADVLPTYSTAKSLIYIADGNMSNYASQLLASLERGDIMLFRAWYADPNNAIMRSDYAAAMPVPSQVSLVASGSSGAVNLAWSQDGNNAVYNIKRATSASGPFAQIASGVFGTGYADTTVTNYQTYYYIVTPVNGAGTGPDSTVASATAAGPTVATAASASPSTVAGTSTNLSVLGSDTSGESTLKYTWASVSTPGNAPPVTFSANGSNLAKNTTAYFYQSGTYLLTATITDTAGYSATSKVTVTVSQTVTSMFVLPPKITLAQGGTQQYSVTARDQYSNTIASPPVTWSATGGTITSGGLFTAGATGGNYTITAVSGAATAGTTVTVQNTAASVIASAAISASLNIGDSDLILSDGGAAGLTAVESEIAQGKIASAAAASDTTHLTTIGVMLNSNGTSAIYSSLDGLPTSLNDVLVKYTYYGDANLDGMVDASDYTRIDSGFLTHATGWANGDFNYDGVINGSDYTLIDNAFNRQTGNLGEASHVSTATQFVCTAKAVPANLFADTPVSTDQNQNGISKLLDELQGGGTQ